MTSLRRLTSPAVVLPSASPETVGAGPASAKASAAPCYVGAVLARAVPCLVALIVGCSRPADDAVTVAQMALTEPEPCTAGQKRCGGLCTVPSAAVGCGMDDCEPCPGWRTGARCNGGACEGGAPAEIGDAEGCPANPSASTPGIPPVPDLGGTCPDAFVAPTGMVAEGCCFHRCFRGRHYYFCNPEFPNIGWIKARNYCRAVGMKLAEIDDHRENEFLVVTSITTVGGPLYAGLNNLGDRNVLRWSDVNTDDGTIVYTNYQNAVVRKGAFTAVNPYASTLECTTGDCVVLVNTNDNWHFQGVDSGGYPFACEAAN